MIKIITTVGTSLITNYKALRNGDDSEFSDMIAKIGDRPAADYENYRESRINSLKSKLKHYVQDPQNSAEMSTIVNWISTQQEIKYCVVYLLCSDTIASKLVAETIKENFKHEKIRFNEIKVLIGAQVDNAELFQETGVQNLIDSIVNIHSVKYEEFSTDIDTFTSLINIANGNNYDSFISLANENNKRIKKLSDLLEAVAIKTGDEITFKKLDKNYSTSELKAIIEKFLSKNLRTVVNISGGFKAFIPIATLVSQLLSIDIIYKYENDNNSLISIPHLPIAFDSWKRELYFPILDEIEVNNGKITYQHSTELSLIIAEMIKNNLILLREKQYGLTPLGRFFLEEIKKSSFVAKDSFGFIAELKLYESIVSNSASNQSKYTRSYVFKDLDVNICGSFTKEFDIVEIKRENNEKFNKVYECKSYQGAVSKKSDFLKKQFIEQIATLKSKMKIPKEYVLCIYLPWYLVNQVDKTLDKTVQNKLSEVYQEMEKILKSKTNGVTRISIKYFVFKNNENSLDSSSFKEFLRHPITLHEFNIN